MKRSYTTTKLRIGDQVYDIADPRHIGRLERISSDYRARVVWNDTGWITDGIYVDNLEKADGL